MFSLRCSRYLCATRLENLPVIDAGLGLHNGRVVAVIDADQLLAGFLAGRVQRQQAGLADA